MAGNFPGSAKDPSTQTGYILYKLLKSKDKEKHLFLSEKKLRGCVKGNCLNNNKNNDERRDLRISGRKKAHSKQRWWNTITFPSPVEFSVLFDR